AITGAGKLRALSQRSRSRAMKASADFWSGFAISLMSAPPIMLFSLWPARMTARMSLSPASFSNPSRTPSVTAELRMLSEPALQIARRTTPLMSRVRPQWGLSISMLVVAPLGAQAPRVPLPWQEPVLSRVAGAELPGAWLRPARDGCAARPPHRPRLPLPPAVPAARGQHIDARAIVQPLAVGGRIVLAIAVRQRKLAVAHAVVALAARDHAAGGGLHRDPFAILRAERCQVGGADEQRAIRIVA